MESYIVRVYRQDKDRAKHIVGIVEKVGVKGRKAFTNFDELWEILAVPESGMQGQMQKRETKKTIKQIGKREKVKEH